MPKLLGRHAAESPEKMPRGMFLTPCVGRGGRKARPTLSVTHLKVIPLLSRPVLSSCALLMVPLCTRAMRLP